MGEIFFVKEKGSEYADLTSAFNEASSGLNSERKTKSAYELAFIESSVDNAKSQSLVFNGNTIFMVGEQIKSTRESQTQEQKMKFEEHFMIEQ